VNAGTGIGRLRTVCLALPKATEKEAWGAPTFRVHERIFAIAQDEEAAPSVWLKAAPGGQEILVGADPVRFFRPPYLGHKGWVGVRLAPAPDWEEVAELVRRSYRLVAPKRLAAGA
jgi:hypothetical protein